MDGRLIAARPFFCVGCSSILLAGLRQWTPGVTRCVITLGVAPAGQRIEPDTGIMDSQQIPVEGMHSKMRFMIFSPEDGVISEHMTKTDAIRAMVRHLQAYPKSGVGLYQRGERSSQLE